jgi:hypothetical protein
MSCASPRVHAMHAWITALECHKALQRFTVQATTPERYTCVIIQIYSVWKESKYLCFSSNGNTKDKNWEKDLIEKTGLRKRPDRDKKMECLARMYKAETRNASIRLNHRLGRGSRPKLFSSWLVFFPSLTPFVGDHFFPKGHWCRFSTADRMAPDPCPSVYPKNQPV